MTHTASLGGNCARPDAAAGPARKAGQRLFGEDALQRKGWWLAHRFLLLRRMVQACIFGMFLLGPWAGIWFVKGNLSSSLTLNTLPLTDPFVLAQTLAAGHMPEITALLGAAIVVVFYALVGGRVYCSWVCPVNVVTDAALWLRRRLGISTGHSPSPRLRHAVLAAVLIASAAVGLPVWESVNPVSMTQRALIFGGTLAWGITAAVFLFDLLVAPRGWCGHVCPMGAMYALLGHKPLLRVAATHASRCNDCADCYAVCPEPRVIPMALKGKGGASPVIDHAACTNCGRCIDVCAPNVFRFTHRFDLRRM